VYNDTIFYGYMLHPEEFMPFFDVFVLPSRAESFGSVFAEAALCHLAIVGSNVGGIPEQIDPGVNGLLVDVDDWKGLADGLEQLILDPDYRYGMARSAYERAKKMYSLTRVISELKKIYVTFGPQM
jgi:glycosyltransferase involved in cell wall biosynthesis